MLKIKNVNKSYKSSQVLFDFTFELDLGKNNVYGLVGPNGAGKTTLLKVIVGLLKYTSGDILAEGEEDYCTWCKEHVILVLAGERGLRYKNTVKDNILFYGALKGIDLNKIKENISYYSGYLNFHEFLDKKAEVLSMGQKKKALLLCGLCTGMDVILLDEPSNGLDIDAQEELAGLIHKISSEMQVTILISSHDLDFLSQVVNRYVFIFGGKNCGTLNGRQDIDTIREKYRALKGEI